MDKDFQEYLIKENKNSLENNLKKEEKKIIVK